LCLYLQAGLSYNEVGRALKISESAVGKYVSLARVAGVDWVVAQTLSDEELECRLYRPPLPRSSYPLTPDFAAVHQELKRPGVTPAAAVGGVRRSQRVGLQVPQLLLEVSGLGSGPEALDAPYPPGRREAVRGLRRPDHAAGGCRHRRDHRRADLRGQLGASNYTYACATQRQTTADWIGAQI
jgi:hypothetical protein